MEGQRGPSTRLGVSCCKRMRIEEKVSTVDRLVGVRSWFLSFHTHLDDAALDSDQLVDEPLVSERRHHGRHQVHLIETYGKIDQ